MSEGIFAKALNAMTPLVTKAFSIYCCLNIFVIVCTLLDSLKVCTHYEGQIECWFLVV